MRIKSHTGLLGTFTVPGDKSISHRALILGTLLNHTLKIDAINDGEDVVCTKNALIDLGANITTTELITTINPPESQSLWPKKRVLWMGNSGTSARLLLGGVAHIKTDISFDGDESLRSRPMNRVMHPLREMGGEFYSQTHHLPLTIRGTDELQPISYTAITPSAQIKSAILLAALYARGISHITEPQKTRDHTENLLDYLGYPITVMPYGESGSVITVQGNQFPPSNQYTLTIPGDPSAAVFWVVACLIIPNSCITIRDVCLNPMRSAVFSILKKMGGRIQIQNERTRCNELIGDLSVQTSNLHGIDIPAIMAPNLIDEYPILSIAATHATGESIFRGLSELRIKESNRLEGMCSGLVSCGIKAWAKDDDLYITGKNFDNLPKNVVINSSHDHRIAMSFVIYGLASKGQNLTIHNPEAIETSFPNFLSQLSGFWYT